MKNVKSKNIPTKKIPKRPPNPRSRISQNDHFHIAKYNFVTYILYNII